MRTVIHPGGLAYIQGVYIQGVWPSSKLIGCSGYIQLFLPSHGRASHELAYPPSRPPPPGADREPVPATRGNLRGSGRRLLGDGSQGGKRTQGREDTHGGRPQDTRDVPRSEQRNKDESCDSLQVRAVPHTVKAGSRGAWPRAGSRERAPEIVRCSWRTATPA
jgi:hypothetical protein